MLFLFFSFSWDAQYEKELSNFKNHGDIGEIWFEDSVDRLLDWILDTNLITTQSSIIDIGCGNGAFLLNLVRVYWIIGINLM